MRPPKGGDLLSLRPLLPILASYVLSFVFVGIYWNNHHHLFQLVERVNGAVLLANLHLLFWLSLIPFASGWMGENHFDTLPVALYGVLLFMCGTAYYILSQSMIAHDGRKSTLARAVGADRKGLLSMVLYIVAVALAFASTAAAIAIYAGVAAMWLIPDRRISKVLGQEHPNP
jgi:uncharacterized membrane protein